MERVNIGWKKKKIQGDFPLWMRSLYQMLHGGSGIRRKPDSDRQYSAKDIENAEISVTGGRGQAMDMVPRVQIIFSPRSTPNNVS